MAENGVIGALRVSLGLDSANFETGMRRVRAQANDTGWAKGMRAALGEVRGSMEGVAAGAGGLGSALSGLGAAGLAAGVGVGGLVAALNGARAATAFADGIADTAAKLAVTTDALQEYRYAVHALGGEYEDADAALEGFTKAFGAAHAQLSAKAIKPFMALGLDPKDFATTEDALRAVIEKISQLKSTAEQAAIADKLGLTPMLTALRAGNGELDSLREKAKSVGYVMDAELVARAGEMNDKFEDLSQVVDVQLKSALVDLAPVLLSLLGLVGDLAKGAAGVADLFRNIQDRSTSTLQDQRTKLQNNVTRLQLREWGGKKLSPTERSKLNRDAIDLTAIDMEIKAREAQAATDAKLKKILDDLARAGANEAKATKSRTQAAKDYIAVAAPMTADMSEVVDVLKNVVAVSPEAVDGLTNLAGEASQAWADALDNDQAALDDALDGMKGAFGNFFEGIVVDGKANWRGLLSSMLNNWQAAFARMQTSGGALASGLGKVIAALGQASGSVSTSIGTAIGQGLGFGTGNGTADLALGVGGAALGTLFAGTGANIALAGTVGTALGAGALGAGVATLLSSAAVLGPIAAIAALAIGTLFKSKPSNNGALATLTGDSFSLSGSKRNDETSQMATAAANAILQGQQALQAAGIKLAATVTSIDIGTRDATDIILSDGRALTSAVGDAAAAAEAGLKAVLQGATYANAAQQKLAESMIAAGKGFDDILKAMQTFSDAQKIPEQLRLAILAIQDPGKAELETLKTTQADRRKAYADLAAQGYLTADMLAGINGQLDVLDKLELDKALTSAGGALGELATRVDDARSQLSAAYDREAQDLRARAEEWATLAKSLSAFAASLTGGAGASASSYAALGEAARAMGARAALGDLTASKELQGTLEAWLNASGLNARTALDAQRDRLKAAAIAGKAAETATRQADIATQQLDALTKLVEGQLGTTQAVLSVADAVRGLQAALAAQAAATAPLTVGGPPVVDLAATVGGAAVSVADLVTTSPTQAVQDLAGYMIPNLEAIAGNTALTLSLFNRWNGDGLPETRVVA